MESPSAASRCAERDGAFALYNTYRGKSALYNDARLAGFHLVATFRQGVDTNREEFAMKLHCEPNLDHQLQAIEAVCDLFRDSAFADDVAKTNLAAILNQDGLQNVRSL